MPSWWPIYSQVRRLARLDSECAEHANVALADRATQRERTNRRVGVGAVSA